MTSSSTFSRSKFTERHFIGDLSSLLMRHKLSCGKPEDLEQLGPALDANPALRSDLFTLCTAISHMSDIDLAPEELLNLVSRAVSGPTTSPGDAIEIPSLTRSAFLNRYEAWLNRKPEKYPFEPEPIEPTPARNIPAATIQGAFARLKPAVSEIVPSQAVQPPAAIASPQPAPSSPPPPAPPAPVPVPVPAIAVREPAPSIPVAPAPVAAVAVPLPALSVPLAHPPIAAIAPPQPSPSLPLAPARTPYPSRSHARIRRLRAVNTVLLVLFLAASLAAGILANRYASLEHNYTDLALKVDHIVASGHAALPPPTSKNPLFAHPSLDASDPAPVAPPNTALAQSAATPATKRPAPVSPPPPPAATGTVLLPGSTLRAFAVSTPPPVFPSTTLTGEDATVDIQATISMYGMVKNTRILRGNAEFGAIAVRAMRTWQFRPYLVDGKPVEVIAGFTFHADAK